MTTKFLYNSLRTPTRRLGQPFHHTHPHLLKKGELSPGISAEEFLNRRNLLAKSMPQHSAVIVPAAPRNFSSHSIPIPYRPDSNVSYYTGFAEHDCVFILEKKTDLESVFHLFVRDREPSAELWDGPRSGPDGVLYFDCNRSYSMSELEGELKNLVRNSKEIFYENTNPELDSVVQRVIYETNTSKYKIKSSRALLETPRLWKSDTEQNLIRKSAQISAESMVEVIKLVKAGVSELELGGYFQYQAAKRGAERLAYPCVVASGLNALTLHYTALDSILKTGELLLLDCGVEYHGYASDVSRVVPVDGKFTGPQRALYELVLSVQKALIKACETETTWQKLQQYGNTLLLEGLQHLKILPQEKELAEREFGSVCPHSVGHWIGLDTHDTITASQSLELLPTMTLTIEPGVYIKDDPAMGDFRGLAVRIEDDILIKSRGKVEVLSENVPKEVADIEHLMAQK